MKKPVVNLKQRKILLPLVGGVLLLVAIGGYLIYQDGQNNQNNKVTRAIVCDEEIIKQASQAISTNNGSVLVDIKPKITALKDYDRDQNCLYVVIVHDITKSDLTSAKDHLGKMKKVYQENGYSKSFAGSTQTLSQLEKSVAFLETTISDLEKEEKSSFERFNRSNRDAEEILKAMNQ